MMTNDLINVQMAIAALIEWYGCEPNDLDAFKEILERMSSTQHKRGKWTGDVAPVVHAHWNVIDAGSEGDEAFCHYWATLKCSQCGFERDVEDDYVPDYCEGCGAKMDERQK